LVFGVWPVGGWRVTRAPYKALETVGRLGQAPNAKPDTPEAKRKALHDLKES